MTWEVVADCDGSDHFPTLIKIKPQYNLNDAFFYNRLSNKRMFYRTKWTDFEYIMEEKTRRKTQLIPRKRACSKRRRGNPWWDKECTQKIKERKAAID